VILVPLVEVWDPFAVTVPI